MDAVLPTTDYIKTRGVDRKILISTIINGFCYVNFLSATSPNTMDGSPARWIELIHQLHIIAGEEGGSATMVAVFCQFLCVVAGCRISSSSSYVEIWYKKLKEGPARCYLVFHIGVHHTHSRSDPPMVGGDQTIYHVP